MRKGKRQRRGEETKEEPPRGIVLAGEVHVVEDAAQGVARDHHRLSPIEVYWTHKEVGSKNRVKKKKQKRNRKETEKKRIFFGKAHCV